MAIKTQELYPAELSFHIAVFNAIQANIAVLDAEGVIVAVNDSWISYGKENQSKDTNYGVGSNYLDACDNARLDPSAREAIQGLRDVMAGKLSLFEQTYSCHSPWQKRWYSMRVVPIEGYPNYVVVSHDVNHEITEESQAQMRNAASSLRLERESRLDKIKCPPAGSESMLLKCAWCKSIKVNGSDGMESWVPAASYVSSIAQITHGICPNCRTELMG